MRILITNDDGINAPGLGSLEKIAREIADDVWTVAPETDQSGLAHSLTLSHPLRLRKLKDQQFALTGTPTDCVIMGVRELMPEPPDLVLSGVKGSLLLFLSSNLSVNSVANILCAWRRINGCEPRWALCKYGADIYCCFGNADLV